MRVKRRRLLIPDFEACSVALFATLALSGPLSARPHSSVPLTTHRSAAPPTAPFALNRLTAEFRKPAK